MSKTRTKVLYGLLGMLLSVVCCIPMSFTNAKATESTVNTTSLVSRGDCDIDPSTGVHLYDEMTLQTQKGKTGLVATVGDHIANKWNYTLNGTFYGNSKIEFVNIGSSFDRYTFAISDLKGNRVLNFASGPAGYSYGMTSANGGTGNGYSISYVTLESEKVSKEQQDDGSGNLRDVTEWTAYSLDTTGAKTKDTLTLTNTYINATAVNSGINGAARSAVQDNAVFYPNQVKSDTASTESGCFGLNFGADSMSVVAYTTLDGGSEKEIVSFAYSNYNDIAALKDGYTVTLYSYYNGNDSHKFLGQGYSSRIPMLLSINDVALNQETVAISQAEGNVYYEGEYEEGGVNYIDLVKGTELNAFAAQEINYFTSGDYGRFVTSVTDGNTLTANETFADKAAGAYSITVGGKNYMVNVLDSFTTTDLVSAGKDIAYPEMTLQTQKGKTGLVAATGDAANNVWNYTLNGTFYGDSKIEFANIGSCYDRYTFAIYDLKGNRVLNFAASGPVGTTYGYAASSYSISYVTLESEKVSVGQQDDGTGEMRDVTTWKYYTLTSTGTESDTITLIDVYYQQNGTNNVDARSKLQDNNVFYPNQVVNASTTTEAGCFGLTFGAESMSVWAKTTSGDREIVSFAYSNYNDIAALKDGYTVKIYSYYDGSGRGAFLGSGYSSRIPMLLSINDVKLDSSTIAVSKADEISYDGEYVADGKNCIKLNQGVELNAFNVTTKSTVLGSSLGEFVVNSTTTTVLAGESFADKAVGEHTLTIRTANGAKEYTVIIEESEESKGKVLEANLTLSSDIIVNYTVELDAGCSEPIATFTFNNNATTVETYKVVDGKYVFSFTGVTPQYLHKDIDISVSAVYEETRSVVCEQKAFSVRDYCEGMLAKSATDLGMSDEKFSAFQTLIVDLLNYGAAAQTQVGVDTDDLANKNLTEAQRALATDYVTPTDRYAKSEGTYDVEIKGASLFLDRKVIMAFAIDCKELDVNDLTVKVTAGGNTYTLTEFVSITIDEVVYYEVRFGSILATDFDRAVKVQVFSGETAISAEITYSVNSFIARNSNDLMKALYSYGKAAENYVAIAQ